MHLLNHAVTKCGLFLLVGAAVIAVGGATLTRLAGLGRTMPLTSFGIVIGGLGLIGVPGTAGFVSKWYLVLAAIEQQQWWLVFAVLLSSLLAVAYVWRFVEVAYCRAPLPDLGTRREAPLALLIPAWLLIAASVYFGFDTSLSVGSAAGAAEMLMGRGK